MYPFHNLMSFVCRNRVSWKQINNRLINKKTKISIRFINLYRLKALIKALFFNQKLKSTIYITTETNDNISISRNLPSWLNVRHTHLTKNLEQHETKPHKKLSMLYIYLPLPKKFCTREKFARYFCNFPVNLLQKL